MPYVPNSAAWLACKSSTKAAKNSKSIIDSSHFCKWCSSDQHLDRHLSLQLQGGAQSIYNTKTAKNYHHSSDQGSFFRSGLGSSPQFAASGFSLIYDSELLTERCRLYHTETVKLLFIMNVTAAMSLRLNITRIIGSEVVYAYHALVDQSTEQLGCTHHDDKWHEEQMIKRQVTYDGFFLLFH